MEETTNKIDIFTAIRPKLRSYLEQRGVKIDDSGFLSCIHPNHDDAHPSCSIGGNTNEEVFHCFSCLPPFEKIRTPKGLVQICNLKLGDEVYSQYGTGTITNITKQESKEETIEVQLQIVRNDNIKFTGNHIFKVVKNISYDFRFFKSLKSKTRSIKYKNKLVISECRADELKENDYVIFPKTAKSVSSVLTGIENIWIKEYTSGPKNNRIITYPINEDTMWLLGLYCAKGSSYRGGITFTLHRNEKLLQEKIKRIIKDNFGLDCSTYEYDYKTNTTNMSCSSTDLQMFFEGFIGKYSSHKYMPDNILCGMNDSFQRAWLNGLFDGDAGKRKPKRLTLVNENLISTAQQVMVNLEIPFSYSFNESYIGNDGIERKPTWSLTRLEKENIGCFYDTAYDGYRYAFLRIDKIYKSKPLMEVYDITVKEVNTDSHTFMTKHYLVHNCGAAGNILHAVHFLEKKPISGLGLYQETLPYIAKLFDIPYEPIEISEDQKREFQKRRAYEDAVNVICSMSYKKVDKKRVLNIEHPAMKHLLARGITEATIKKFQIGCIESYKDYLDEMKVLGWSDKSYLEAADLANRKLFSTTGIIIPIFDDKGRAVGFVTRRTDMDANAHGEEKYINSQNSDIYHKSEILFNYNNCRPEDGPLFIVEGYLDAVYLVQAGISNVTAIGATMLTEEHVDMLFRDKFKNIVICLDSDDGGRRGVKLAIERLAGYKNFKVRIMELPEGFDPDSYVRQFGTEKFLELSKSDVSLSPFTWMLKWTTFEDDPMETAKKAIPTIAAEESNIVRLQMVRELARLTAISESDIRKDVDSLVNKESSRFLEELSDINNFVQVQLSRKKTRDTKSILEEGLLKIKSLEKQYNNAIDNKSEYVSKLEDVKTRIESGEFKYGMRAMKFKKFYENFDGIPYTTCLSLVGGRPSAGKTMWMTSLAMDIIDTEEDAAIFYMSIDDTTELMTLKMLAMKSGLSTSEIKRYSELTPDKKVSVEQAWRWIESNSDRFILADATAGNTIDALEAHVDWFTKNYKTPKKLFLLDNFHKLRFNIGGRNKKTDVVSDGSERIKELTQLNDLHIMATVELRKLEGSQSRPQLADLKDSVQLEYDADIIILVHNDKQVKEDTYLVWEGPSKDGLIRAMPYIEVNIWKNKITGQLRPIGYKLNDYNLRMDEVPESEIRALKDKKTNGNNVIGRPRGI